MQGKNNIIDDILGAAKRSAAAMVKDAEDEAQASQAAVREELEKTRAASAESAREAADSLYNGIVKLGELEAGKIMLKKKRDCVDAVYDGVRSRVLKMKDTEYLDFLARLISGACEDGDEIKIGSCDAKRVTAAWIKKLSTSVKKKLTLSKECGEFDGGVILCGKSDVRDLTLDELIGELRERTEAETVKFLGL